MNAITPAGRVHPVAQLPTSRPMFKRSPSLTTTSSSSKGAVGDAEFTLPGIMRAAESEGYDYKEPPPKGLKVTMYEYQRSTYQWLLDHERDEHGGLNAYFWETWEWRDGANEDGGRFLFFPLAGELRLIKPPHRTGGLLCEEMGLGKTLEILSLVLGNPRTDLMDVVSDNKSSNKSNKEAGKPGGSSSNSRRHGEKEGDEEDDDDDDDELLLSSASTSDKKGAVAAPREAIPLVKSKATLIILPASLIGQWNSEVTKLCEEGTCNVTLYTGPQRFTMPLTMLHHVDTEAPLITPTPSHLQPPTDFKHIKHVLIPWDDPLDPSTSSAAATQEAKQFRRVKVVGKFGYTSVDVAVSFTISELAKSDIVLTTYDVVRTAGAVLKRIDWHRIVLDECQEIRTATTQIAKLCSVLHATHRWMVSGTPLATSIDDLHGELNFLDVWPFSLKNDGFWETKIAEPMKRKDPQALLLVQQLISVTMMRHSKAQSYLDGRPLVSLPLRTIVWQPIEALSLSEKYIYYYLEVIASKECRRLADQAIEVAIHRQENDNHDDDEDDEDGNPPSTTATTRRGRSRSRRRPSSTTGPVSQYGKLRALLFFLQRCLTHPSLVPLQQLDTIKRSLQVQERIAANGADDIPRLRVDDILMRLQGVGVGRPGGLSRDVGRTWALGGESLMEARSKFESMSLHHLKELVREHGLPTPICWLSLPLRATINKMSDVMDVVIHQDPDEDKKKKKKKGSKQAAASSSSSNGDHHHHHHDDDDDEEEHGGDNDGDGHDGGAAGGGDDGEKPPPRVDTLLAAEDVVRVGSATDMDVEGVIREVKVVTKKGSITEGDMGEVRLERPWRGDSKTATTVYKRAVASRKKAFIDLLLAKEKEEKGITSELHEAGFGAIYKILEGRDVTCAICLCAMQEPTITLCCHAYCKACILAQLEQSEEHGQTSTRCAICRKPVSRKNLMQIDCEAMEQYNAMQAEEQQQQQQEGGGSSSGGGGGDSAAGGGPHLEVVVDLTISSSGGGGGGGDGGGGDGGGGKSNGFHPHDPNGKLPARLSATATTTTTTTTTTSTNTETSATTAGGGGSRRSGRKRTMSARGELAAATLLSPQGRGARGGGGGGGGASSSGQQDQHHDEEDEEGDDHVPPSREGSRPWTCSSALPAVGFPPTADERVLATIPDPFHFARDNRTPSLDPSYLAHYNNCSTIISSKVKVMLEDMDKTLASDSTSKFVIFSLFHEAIPLLASMLKSRDIQSVHMSGNTSKAARQRATTSFAKDPDVKVFLLTMGSGAVGLTLTSANVLYMLGPSHSLADEAQALNRAHRIGQTRPVRCVIYYVKGSVEERMLAVRRKEAGGDDASLMLESAEALCVTRGGAGEGERGGGGGSGGTQFSLEQLMVLFGMSTTGMNALTAAARRGRTEEEDDDDDDA